MITVNIKMMSGDIIPITYDNKTENISDLIEQYIPYDNKNYIFKLFDSENKEENDSKCLDIFFYPKTFNISILFLENSIFWFSSETNNRKKNVNSSSWIDYIFYKKYLVRISNNNNYVMECPFYHRINNSIEKETFIPFSSVKIMSYLNQVDNAVIDDKKPIYNSLIDMIDQMLSKDFSGITREDLLRDISNKWIRELEIQPV